MTLVNLNSLFNAPILEAVPIDAEVNFTLSKGSSSIAMGRGNLRYSVCDRPFVLSNYRVAVTSMCAKTKLDFATNIETLKVTQKIFPFNDWADNFVINWQKDGVGQQGIIRRIAGTTDKYRLCKQYYAGKYQTIKPIYYFDPEARVEIDSSPITTELDRSTGILTSSSDLTQSTFEAELFYKPVSFRGEVEIMGYYARGNDLEEIAIDSNPEEFSNQLYSSNFDLEERLIDEKLEHDFLAQPQKQTDLSIEGLQLALYRSQQMQKLSMRVLEYRFNSFVAKQDRVNQTLEKTFIIPSRRVSHDRLHYWYTLYNATGGTSFTLSTAP